MTYSIYILPLIITTALTACAPSTSSEPVQTDVPALPAVDLTITDAVETDVRFSAATFVLNNVAQWQSRTLLLDDTGRVHRLDVTGRQLMDTDIDGLIDIAAIRRINEAGIFLGLSETGDVSAYRLADDAGNFEAVAANMTGSAPLSGFCKSGNPLETTVWGYGEEGLVKIDLSSISDSAVDIALSVARDPGSQISSCLFTPDAEITALIAGRDGGQYVYFDGTDFTDLDVDTVFAVPVATSQITMGTFAGSDQAGLQTDDALYRVNIADGLSTEGMETIGFVAVTDESLGATYSNGAVLAQNADGTRLAIVSMDRVLNTLGDSD